MSALGQKRKSERVQSMSASPPKADIRTQPRNVRFVPKADISRSLDQLVSSGEQRRRHGKVKRLCGLEVDDELILRWRLHRHVGWLLTFQDAVDVAGRLAEQVDKIRTVGDQATGRDHCMIEVDRGQSVPSRQRDYQITMNDR